MEIFAENPAFTGVKRAFRVTPDRWRNKVWWRIGLQSQYLAILEYIIQSSGLPKPAQATISQDPYAATLNTTALHLGAAAPVELQEFLHEMPVSVAPYI